MAGENGGRSVFGVGDAAQQFVGTTVDMSFNSAKLLIGEER